MNNLAKYKVKDITSQEKTYYLSLIDDHYNRYFASEMFSYIIHVLIYILYPSSYKRQHCQGNFESSRRYNQFAVKLLSDRIVSLSRGLV